jgi:hypothetical protein
MILTVGLLGMLWINTSLSQGAFTLTDLQQQRAQLLETEQRLAEQLARAESPAQVEAAARELGMVPQEVPVFVRLSDGQIIGNPIPQPEPAPVMDATQAPADSTMETGGAQGAADGGESGATDSGTAESGTAEPDATEPVAEVPAEVAP